MIVLDDLVISEEKVYLWKKVFYGLKPGGPETFSFEKYYVCVFNSDIKVEIDEIKFKELKKQLSEFNSAKLIIKEV